MNQVKQTDYWKFNERVGVKITSQKKDDFCKKENDLA